MAEEHDLTDAIVENASNPAEARGDAASVRQHSLPDQIAADKYLRAKQAQAAGGTGIKFMRVIPPGIS